MLEAGSERQGQVHPHPGGLRQAVSQRDGLGLPDRTAKRARRARDLLAARQNARRLVVDERDDVGARLRRGLRRVGRGRRRAMELRARRAVLAAHRESDRCRSAASAARAPPPPRGWPRYRNAATGWRSPIRRRRKDFAKHVSRSEEVARWSTADAYLRPALKRRNLTLAHRGRRDEGDLRRPPRRRRRIRRTDGTRQVVRARRDVVLCGGAINTPQLLMLSGIGDRDQLNRARTSTWWRTLRRRRQPARPPRGAAGFRLRRTTRCSPPRNPWSW